MEYETASDIIAGLDAEQKAAASAITGPVAIVAGAGTGKTRTITHRIAYACRMGEWMAHEVLAVTFTAKAAREMLERLETLGITTATVSTFHAAALSQLHAYWPSAVGTEPPKLEANKLKHVIGAAKYHNLELTKSEAVAVADEIGWCKVSMVSPSEYEIVSEEMDRQISAPVTPKTFARIYDTYDNIKSELGLIDFEDALLLMLHLINTREGIASEIRSKYKHIIVDEFQDVSPLQQSLLDAWLGKSRELCVVGDPSQTIYSFTGATPNYLLNFNAKYKPKYASDPAPKRINLVNDYRSSKNIVKLANDVLKFRGAEGFEPLDLVSKAKVQDKPVVWNVYTSDDAEAKRTAISIKKLIDEKVYSEQQIAILTRTNLQLDTFACELRALGVPAYIKGDNGKLSEDESVKVIAPPENSVTLASLHSSKGLEWECVFLTGLSDGQMPISRAKDEYSIEEERRLLYVGITRAKEMLTMSYARAKNAGARALRQRSRFLDQIWPAKYGGDSA